MTASLYQIQIECATCAQATAKQSRSQAFFHIGRQDEP